MYPRVVIETQKLKENTAIVVDMAKKAHIDLWAVSKVYCAMPELALASLDGGVVGIADSRIENLKRISKIQCEKALLRLPMLSEVIDVVEFTDISLNSELATIKALNQAAESLKKKHKIILMVDLGDLREGILPEDVMETVKAILELDHIILEGIGVNLTCYGGVMPTPDNLGTLVKIGESIEEAFQIKLNRISGGNSSSLYLIDKGQMPSEINLLRIGEAIVLGRETAYGDQIQGTHDDCFILETQIVEIKEKDSLPHGEIGMDAFGNKPVFEDKGKMLRGIVAIGRQDVDPDGLLPFDSSLEIIGASSDHMIIDFTHSQTPAQIGDIVRFKMDYSALLKLMTSQYVTKEIVDK